MSKKKISEEHKTLLQMSYEIAEEEDRSTEYMIEYMKDHLMLISSTPINDNDAHDKVMQFLEEQSD